MSHVVEEWVWHECQVEDSRPRFVLLAIARHCANDAGTGAYPSLNRLARMVRANRKTVMSALERLEADGELLVWRPDVPGKARHNHYAVVMGRDPADVRRLVEERHRPRSKRSGSAPAQVASIGPALVQQRSNNGPVTVRSHAHQRTGREQEQEQERASAARSSPARAASSTDPRLEPLRRELDGIAVSWQMTDEQAAAMAALIEVHGVRTLAAAALELVTARGRPTFARAWLGAWRALPVPGQQQVQVDEARPVQRERPWCGQCDAATFRFVVDDAGTPLHACPRCHPTSHLEPAF